MPRIVFIFFILGFLVVMGAWYLGPNKSPRALVAASVATELPARFTPPAVTPQPTPTSLRAPRPAPPLREELQQEINQLQLQLNEEIAKVENQKRTIETLYGKQQSLAGPASYSSQIRSREITIQNLIDDIGSFRQAEEDLNLTADLSLRNQDSQARVARDQVDAEIAVLEKDIQNTQNDLSYWQNYAAGVNVFNQPAEVESLQNRLDEQKTQLNNLRVQRIDISADVLRNLETTTELAARAREDLRALEAETQAQIYTLRGEVDRLQSAQYQSQNEFQSLRVQISRAQKDLESLEQQVQRLRTALEEKQKELNSNL